MTLFSRADKSWLSDWWWTVDRKLLGGFITLIVIGVVLVAAASPAVAEHIGRNEFAFIWKTLVFAPATLFLLIGVSMLPEKWIRRGAVIVFVCAFLGVLLTYFLGSEVKGAQRWIPVFGFTLQPSEFLKPAVIIVSAWLIVLQKKNEDFPGLLAAILLVLIAMIVLFFQPDFGMTFLILLIFLTQLALAGVKLRYFMGLIVFGVFLVGTAYMTHDHVRSRIDGFFNPEKMDTYQIDRSLEAFRAGGLFGEGLGQGSVKLRLPDAHTDFIFSVAGEEMGFLALVMILTLYGVIVWWGLKKLSESENLFAILAGGGLVTMFGLQSLIHMGSTLELLPTKGMTLPFISYGGSSGLSMGLAMGAFLALTRRQGRQVIARAGLKRTPAREEHKNI